MPGYIKQTSLLFCMVALVFLLGCSAAQPPQVTEDTSSEEDIIQVPQDESFNPLTLEEKDLIQLPPSRLKIPEAETSTFETPTPAAPEAELKEVAGYRVQIFVTREEFEARQAEEKALLEFDESIYLIFESPNYKIRVGDCRTRAEANLLRETAVKLGYRDAWVVQSKVISAER